MKHYIQCDLSIIVSILPIQVCKAENFNITLKSKWYDLDENCTKATEFGGSGFLLAALSSNDAKILFPYKQLTSTGMATLLTIS